VIGASVHFKGAPCVHHRATYVTTVLVASREMLWLQVIPYVAPGPVGEPVALGARKQPRRQVPHNVAIQVAICVCSCGSIAWNHFNFNYFFLLQANSWQGSIINKRNGARHYAVCGKYSGEPLEQSWCRRQRCSPGRDTGSVQESAWTQCACGRCCASHGRPCGRYCKGVCGCRWGRGWCSCRGFPQPPKPQFGLNIQRRL